jgi:hypothetical protein
MPLNAYFFAAIGTCTQIRSTRTRSGVVETAQNWDACNSRVVFGQSGEDAQKRFDAFLHLQPEGEQPLTVEVRKMTSTPFTDKLLTEAGNLPLEWPKVLSQIEALLESTQVDDFEQGYWVDVDQVVHPDKLSFSAGTLELSVPEDVRSGLNWSPEKKFFFLVSALSPPPPPPDPAMLYDEPEPNGAEVDNEDPAELENLCATFPMACDKDAVALVQARNSVVAAWLWRTYAAKTPLAARSIRIDPWPGTLGAPGN